MTLRQALFARPIIWLGTLACSLDSPRLAKATCWLGRLAGFEDAR
jgi:hypothetical protein